ncbi:MAG: hypothetical protein AB2693_28480, partial [Candidatus Thiodiazotropha sp.]
MNTSISVQGVHGQGKSQGILFFYKVRELSGNFDIGQVILHFQPKVREKSANFEKVYESQKVSRIKAKAVSSCLG